MTLEEAIDARRTMMASGDPEQATAAATELGVFLADDPARLDEAAVCFRRVVEIGLAGAVPAALVNLAGVLFRQGHLDDAEQTYQDALDTDDPAIVPAAGYGLGILLASQPERVAEAIAALRDVAATTDPEYAPLAAYDAGVILSSGGRTEEAVASWRDAVRTGHPDHAPRSAFNLGVVLTELGRFDEAEEAYRAAIASGHEEAAPAAAVNLAELLATQPNRADDVAAAYVIAIDARHPEQTPMALANWGSLLARNGERQAAAQVLAAAVETDHPVHSPRAANNLGLLLKDDPEQREVAEAAFRYAAEVAAEPLASEASYNLGRFIAEDPARHGDAETWLRRGAMSADPRVRSFAESLIAVVVPGRLVPDLEGWRIDGVVDVESLHLEEYLRVGDRIETWREIVTVTRRELADDLSLATVAATLRSAIEAGVVDGRFDWTVLADDGTELVYESTLVDDAAALDQTELVRLVRQDRFLHTVQHAVRGAVEAAGAEHAARLAFLRAATISTAPPPAPPDLPIEPPDVTSQVDELLSGSSTPTEPGRAAILRRMIGQVAYRRDPGRLTRLRLLLGAELAVADGADSIDEAIEVFRRVLAVLQPDPADVLRPHTLRLLADVWRRRADTFEHDPADVVRDRAHAVACLRSAEALLPPGSADWGEVVLDRAVIELAADSTRGGESLRELVRVLDNQPPEFDKDESDRIVTIVGRATGLLLQVEREHAGGLTLHRRPEDPPADEKGMAIYLRPLVTNADLLLPNRFTESSRVRFEHEPEQLTVEATIYRSIGWRWAMLSIGEIQEGFGGGRMNITRGGTEWQEPVSIALGTADLVILLPHSSEGVAWEMTHLRDTGLIERTLFVMPPTMPAFDAAALWTAGAELGRSLGLRLPDYDPAGRFLVADRSGEMVESWPFAEVWDDRLSERLARFARRT